METGLVTWSTTIKFSGAKALTATTRVRFPRPVFRPGDLSQKVDLAAVLRKD